MKILDKKKRSYGKDLLKIVKEKHLRYYLDTIIDDMNINIYIIPRYISIIKSICGKIFYKKIYILLILFVKKVYIAVNLQKRQ